MVLAPGWGKLGLKKQAVSLDALLLERLQRFAHESFLVVD
jgi:hypothetical protein